MKRAWRHPTVDATLPPTPATRACANIARRVSWPRPRPEVRRRLEDNLLRKLGALVLGIPVLIMVYLASLLRRGGKARIGAGLAAVAVVGLVVVASLPPAPTAAIPASGKPAPVAASLMESVRTGHGLGSPFVVEFSAPMDAATVAAALRIEPDAAVSLSWDPSVTVLTITPVDHWQPDTLYSVTVDALARAADGGALKAPVRALVLTAAAGSATIAATRPVEQRVRTDTAFLLTFDRDISVDAVRSALRSDPVIHGDVTETDTPGELLLTPYGPLAADTTYRISLEDLRDTDGIPFGKTPGIEVTTSPAPGVVRFRPRNGTSDADRSSVLSVRFTEPMDHAKTAAAFSATVGDKQIAGKISWAEGDTVLVFDPASDLAYSSKVTMTVDLRAMSRAGVPIGKVATGAFTVVAKPKPKPKPKPVATKAPTTTIPKSGGSGAVSGSWTAVESYYLKLMNCTRTGGWVTSTGACSSPGGRNVAALKLDAGISSKVSRPYAKLLATRGLCDHFIGGTPGDRLRKAGYTSYRWAENLGCRSGDPYAAVLGSHLFFQNEKSTNGGHYVNLMNAAYDRVGIGVWVSSGRVRLVVDFYHP